MGTNYYLHDMSPTKPPCECCGREYPPVEVLHIGKDGGPDWCFSLHVIPKLGLNSLSAWMERWCMPNMEIRSELGDPLTPEEMLRIITERGEDSFKRLTGAQIRVRNNAVVGPRGLWRHQQGPHCIGYGEGTWDLIPGEFF